MATRKKSTKHLPPPPEAAARGGRAKTPAKLEALAALHESRRGKRINATGPRVRQALARGAELMREWNAPGPVLALGAGARDLARRCGVSDRTVRRWLAGDDWPEGRHHARILAWYAEVKAAAQRLRRQMR